MFLYLFLFCLWDFLHFESFVIYFFLSCFGFLFKGFRIIFILISFEFIVLFVFFLCSSVFSLFAFFFVMVVSVLSRTLGLIFLVVALSFYGQDYSLFCFVALSFLDFLWFYFRWFLYIIFLLIRFIWFGGFFLSFSFLLFW